MVLKKIHSRSARKSSSYGRQDRVPKALQAVYLMSNQGKAFDSPPPESCDKPFWFFQRQTTAMDPMVLDRDDKQPRPALFRTSTNRQRSATGLPAKSCQQLSPPQSPAKASYQGSPKERSTKDGQCLPSPKPSTIIPMQMSPQGYLDSLLRSRGYSCQKYRVLQSAYYNKPTLLQMASYHAKLLDLVKQHDGTKLREMIMAGLSRNPCNQHGESLIHSICRRGDYKLLHVMIDTGATVQVSDDHGRTPLHDACWSSSASFAVVDIILQQDARLIHMMDVRGATPLMYIRNEDWTHWLKFLRSRVDLYWPPRNVVADVESELPQPQGPPPLTLLGPNTKPLPDPANALPLDIASMMVSGRITPCETAMLCASVGEETDDYDDSSCTDSDCFFSDSDDNTEGGNFEQDQDSAEDDADANPYADADEDVGVNELSQRVLLVSNGSSHFPTTLSASAVGVSSVIGSSSFDDDDSETDRCNERFYFF